MFYGYGKNDTVIPMPELFGNRRLAGRAYVPHVESYRDSIMRSVSTSSAICATGLPRTISRRESCKKTCGKNPVENPAENPMQRILRISTAIVTTRYKPRYSDTRVGDQSQLIIISQLPAFARSTMRTFECWQRHTGTSRAWQ